MLFKHLVSIRIFGLFITGGLFFTSVYAGANIENGKQKSIVCQGCHGENGNSLGPDWPHLAGQHSNYILKQISNFQTKTRINETMNDMAAGVSAEDAIDIAAYFAAQKIVPSTDKFDNIALETGKMIYRGGNSFTGVPACSSCHGPNGAGNSPGKFPKLAGQRKEYVIKTLKDFKAGRRANDPNEIMRTIARKMTLNEIKSVATYIAYIPTDRNLK